MTARPLNAVIIDQAVNLLTCGGGEQAAPIVETPVDEVQAFGVERCATRLVRPAWWDAAWHWPVLPGVGEDVIVSRLASLGLSESGQATWSVSCQSTILGTFCAPETSTYDELGGWAALTVSALHRRGDLIEDPRTGQLAPADRTSRN